MKKLLIVPILLLLFSLNSLAQKTIEGSIRDSEGNPVIGVFVSYVGSTEIIPSDVRGEFKIVVPKNIFQLSFDYFTCPEPIVEQIPSNGKMNVKLNCVVELEGFVVTGSVERSSVSATIFPIDRLNVKNLALTGSFIDINSALSASLPSVQSNRQTIADGTDHIDPVAIRGLGPDQTLLLVNGKRYHKTALINVNRTTNRGTAGADLSSIPFGAIDRIEVLRDGAAAQYGSDAIAGVVNVILKSKEQGLRFQVNSGMNISSFPRNYYINHSQNSNKLYELNDNATVYDGKYVRISGGYGFTFNKKTVSSVEPSFVQITTEVGLREATNRAGTYTGQIYPRVGNQNVDEPTLLARNLTRRDFDMRIGASAIDNYGIAVNSEHSFWKGSRLYISGIGGMKYGEAAGFYRFPNSGSQGTSFPAAAFAEISRQYPNGFLPLIQTEILDYSVIGGFRQQIGKQFEIDMSSTLGRNNFDYLVDNSINYTRAKANTPIQTSFDCGGLSFEHKVYNFTLQKKSGLSTEKARLAFSLGGEYRQEAFSIRAGEPASYENYNLPNDVAGAQVFPGFKPPDAGLSNRAERNNIAAFLDVALSDLIPKLKLEAAYRFEHYSDFGTTHNYKLGARYDFFDGDKLGIRGSYNTGFRAPSLHQIGYTKVNNVFVGTQARQAITFRNDSPAAKELGIDPLEPETSQNYSVGIVSKINKELRLSIDAYQIDIDRRIILTNDFSGASNPRLAERLRPFNATNANFFTNAIDTRATGVEGVLYYEKRWPINNKRLSAELSASVFRNAVLDSIDVLGTGSNKPFIYASDVLISLDEVRNYFNREDESRLEMALPNTKVVGSISYETGDIVLNLRSTYYGQVQYIDPSTATPINVFTGQPESLDQTYRPKIVTDFSMQFKISKFRLGFGCNNILDVYPDVHKHSANFSDGRFIYSRRVHQMGLNGRSIFVNLVYFSKKQ